MFLGQKSSTFVLFNKRVRKKERKREPLQEEDQYSLQGNWNWSLFDLQKKRRFFPFLLDSHHIIFSRSCLTGWSLPVFPSSSYFIPCDFVSLFLPLQSSIVNERSNWTGNKRFSFSLSLTSESREKSKEKKSMKRNKIPKEAEGRKEMAKKAETGIKTWVTPVSLCDQHPFSRSN